MEARAADLQIAVNNAAVDLQNAKAMASDLAKRFEVACRDRDAFDKMAQERGVEAAG